MVLKMMPRSHKGHKFILCITDEVTNYLITVPIYPSRLEEIDVLIDNAISKYGIPEYIIMDQDSAFMSKLMNYLFKKLNIKIKCPMQSSVFASRAWNKIPINDID